MLIEELKRDSDKYYFLCAAGIGDTMIVCGFYNALKKKYKADIVIVVPEKQAFIPKMFGIENYAAVDLGVNGIDELLTKYVNLSDKAPLPQKGEFYLCNFCFHNECPDFTIPLYFRKANKDFLSMYKSFLHLSPETPFEDFKILPKLSEKTKNIVLNFAPFDKIIMVSPEATSTEQIPEKFWRQKVTELKKAGYTVISNVKDKNNTINGSVWIPLSLQDSIALAYLCHSVYSVRSGFCDLCYQLGSKLHVYYANRDDLYLYSLQTMFDKNINEYVEYNLPDKFIRGKNSAPSLCPGTLHLPFKRKYYLLGIPVLKIRRNPGKIKIYLFGIPVFKIKDYY